MKIAIDIRSVTASQPSGVGQAVRAWLFALQAQPDTHEYLLFTTGRKRATLPESLENDPRFTLVQPKGPSKLWNLGIALNLVKLEHLLGTTVDAVWYPNTGFLPKTRAKTLLTVHDLAFLVMPDTYTRIDHLRYRITRARTWIRRADLVSAVSEATARDLHDLFDRKATVTPLGVDRDTFHPRPTASEATDLQKHGVRTPYLLSLATREPRKNIASLIEAHANLCDQGHPVQLVIAGGSGWKRRTFEAALSASPHKDRILVLGYIADYVRPQLLRGAEALVLASRYEGFGMQILEALASGTPVITGANTSLAEVTHTHALHSPSMDPASLTGTLKQHLTDPDLGKRLSANGPVRAEAFTWETSARTLLNLLTNDKHPTETRRAL